MGSSIRSTAKALGISEATLRSFIKRGVVTTNPDGTLDVERARLEYAANVRPKSDGKHNGHAALSYSQERAGRERTRGERETLELARLRGELVSAADVKRDAFLAARRSRDRVLLIGNRLLPSLLPLVPESERPTALRLVEGELNACCEDLSIPSAYTTKRPRRRTGT